MLTSASLHLRDFLVANFWFFVEGSLRKKIGKNMFFQQNNPTFENYKRIEK
jgi:hypothetical protein